MTGFRALNVVALMSADAAIAGCHDDGCDTNDRRCNGTKVEVCVLGSDEEPNVPNVWSPEPCQFDCVSADGYAFCPGTAAPIAECRGRRHGCRNNHQILCAGGYAVPPYTHRHLEPPVEPPLPCGDRFCI